MHIENPGRVWANPELVKPIGVISARQPNGGRAMPRTSASYVLNTVHGKIRDPVIVTDSNGNRTIKDGSAFCKRDKTAHKAVKDSYAAGIVATPKLANATPGRDRALLERIGSIGDQD